MTVDANGINFNISKDVLAAYPGLNEGQILYLNYNDFAGNQTTGILQSTGGRRSLILKAFHLQPNRQWLRRSHLLESNISTVN